MTAVVGILNKRGVAIAADSAVTRNRPRIREKKVTKNGNKMLRVSNAVPVSVMITGNADFLGNPWEVVVRCYRRERGNIPHPTVEACLHDLFDYIASNEQIWNSNHANHLLEAILDDVFYGAESSVGNVGERPKSRTYTLSKIYVRDFLKQLKKQRDAELACGVCPQFENFTIDSFRIFAQSTINNWMEDQTDRRRTHPPYPKAFMSEIKDALEQVVFAKLTTRAEDEVGCVSQSSSTTELIFTGYGAEQEYPSLIPVLVGGGFANRVNYHVRKQDIVCISDENPVAICPFAQVDISTAIIKGMQRKCAVSIYEQLLESLTYNGSAIFGEVGDDDLDCEFMAMLSEVKVRDLGDRMVKEINNRRNKTQQEWEKQLVNYDLKAMAALAESMIDLTGFQRILTFQQEGVGGPVDVAVITKNDGFSWLSRKSWYHHKDVNGHYGKLGI